MKFTKYILSLLVLVFAVSCTIDDEFESSKNNDGKIRLVTRVVPFNEYDVQTRAAGDEETINFIDYFIFAKVGNTGGPEDYLCVYYHHSNSQTIAIDRTTDFEDIIANGRQDILQNCQIVVLANYPAIQQTIAEYADSLGYGTDVERFMDERILYKGTGDPTQYINASVFRSIAMNVPTSVGIPADGLPRMGDYKQVVDLRPDADISGDVYPVNLQSLYAKMVFDINVRAIQTDVTTDETGNTFQFTGYTVHNLVKKLDMVGGTESAEGENEGTNDATATYTDSIPGDLTNSESGPTHTSFICYLPERYLQAHTSAENYQYPFGKSPNIRKEDSVLLQRYKPLLVADTVNKPKATFVRFSGVYTNHQGHNYEVSYDIYVGNDNYSNFDVVRNRQYNNSITIKGIETSKDQSSVEGAVSIDHRVTIDRQSPIIVNFRRETLLDSHFEVRPLRISCKNANATGTVKVEVLTYDTTHVGSGPDFEVIATIGGTSGTERPDWIRLERSYGDGKTVNTSLYCHNGELGASSNGKRKYFTYNLVSGKNAAGGEDLTNTLKDSVSVEVPLSELAFNPSTPNPAGCVWVYVDECLEASVNPLSVRQALIRVTYNGDTTDYVVNQHRLLKVSYTPDGASEPNIYYIEHEEEYLHNFDADDNYEDNQTEFEGMEWGLYNTQLSFRNEALFFGSDEEWGSGLWGIIMGVINWIVDYVKESAKDGAGLRPIYDFYIERHDESVSNKAIKYPNNDVPEQHGLYFTKNIVNDINGVTGNATGYKSDDEVDDRPDNILKLKLNELPQSAIEYCYNRNKRNSDGTITTNNITWYMPAIDEMEDVMVAANGQFIEFQGQFYWSCQPSFIQSYAHLDDVQGWVNEEGVFYSDDRGIYMQIKDVDTLVNVGRARATKANFVGPGPNNYVYASSGIDGYDDAYRITSTWEGGLFGSWKYNLEPKYIDSYSGLNNKSISLYNWAKYPTEQMDYDEGNQLRSEKNRVRALVDKTKITREVND